MNEKEFELLEIKPENIKPVVQTVIQYQKKLNLNKCEPDFSHAFSICVEYAKAWFKDGFQSDFFKAEYVSGANILNSFRSKDAHGLAKVQKPALAIVPELDQDFDNDGLASDLHGNSVVTNSMRYSDSFFNDLTKKTSMTINMELMLVRFTYKVKVSSAAQGRRLLKYIKHKYFVGATRGERRDLDFNIPTELMLRVAIDGGFTIKDNQVVNMNEFIYYLNSHSELPFIYKYRDNKGIFEYFIRLPSQYIHTRSTRASMDDGEREGQIENNYIVTLETEVRFPYPDYYAYYTINKHENVILENRDHSYSMAEFCLCPIPTVNAKGWGQIFNWDYVEDDDVYDKKEVSKIYFEEPLTGMSNGRIKVVVDDLKGKYLSPSIFIDFKIFNDNNESKIEVDWENLCIKTDKVLTSKTSHIVGYMDLAYYNEYLISKEAYLQTRITKQKDQYNNYPDL